MEWKGEQQLQTFDTLADGAASYKPAEFELAIYADTHDACAQRSELLAAHLDQNGSTIGGIEFSPVMLREESEIEQAVPEGEEMPVYLRVQNYRMLYRVVG